MQLLNLCLESEIPRVYVHIDGPTSPDASEDTKKCAIVLQTFSERHPFLLRQRISSTNLGAASAVISSCNWAFENEEFLVILEDDCLPSPTFFEYVIQAKRYLDTSQNLFAISGSQPAPPEVVGGNWCLSSYFLGWGWATSRVKWQEIYLEILNLDLRRIKRGFLDWSEFLYWKSGARRAIQGFVDAWDIPLMLIFRTRNSRVVVPGRNLITNVGNDRVATHTSNGSEWILTPTFEHTSSSQPPAENPILDAWLQKKVFKIAPRHILSTRFTLMKDLLGLSKRVRSPLRQRLSRIQ